MGVHRSSWVALSGGTTRSMAQTVSRTPGSRRSLAGTVGADSIDRLGNPKILSEGPEERHIPGSGGTGGLESVQEVSYLLGSALHLSFHAQVAKEADLDLPILPIGFPFFEIDPIADPSARDKAHVECIHTTRL